MDALKAFIVDIDGTVADVSHRRHHVAGPGRPNWKKFFEAMGDDIPFHTVIGVIEALVSHHDPETEQFFICSGRPEDYRGVTEKWLAEHCPDLWEATGPEYLLMRPSGDFRSDVAAKGEMLKAIRGQGFDVVATFDDRDGVVAMWRSHGITCFQTAPGDWDTRPAVSPGKLYMMVGPSGSGKSTFVNNTYSPSVIVSSDALRAELNSGDIQDQTKNKQVFSGLRAMVKARVENGFDVVVDATNLRNKDRRVLRDAVPRTCHIIYMVIDRPLEEKHRDAGWRAGVSVKGQLLIDYHHNTFKSNLKAILAGDDDPRVDVIDMRAEGAK